MNLILPGSNPIEVRFVGIDDAFERSRRLIELGAQLMNPPPELTIPVRFAEIHRAGVTLTLVDGTRLTLYQPDTWLSLGGVKLRRVFGPNRRPDVGGRLDEVTR